MIDCISPEKDHYKTLPSLAAGSDFTMADLVVDGFPQNNIPIDNTFVDHW